jgi:hypothetical protein
MSRLSAQKTFAEQDMGDERRNEGNGAVVAIVLILGIVALLGVVVVVGGALLFVAESAPVQIQTPPVSTTVAPAQPVPSEPDPDLENVGTQIEKTDAPSN